MVIGGFRLYDVVSKVLSNILIYLAMIFYISFGRVFVDAPAIVPNLDRGIRRVVKWMLGYMVLATVWILSAQLPEWQRIVHVAASLFFFLFFVHVLYRVLLTGAVVGKFLVSGSSLMAIGIIYNLMFRYLNPQPLPGELNGNFFLQMGIIMELICLNIGLIYKSKQIAESAAVSRRPVGILIPEDEKRQADLNAVRNEISRELRQELGEGLSGIKLMTERVQQKMGGLHIRELERISENSERLVRSMNEIVWSLDHLNDDLPGLIAYLREYATCFTDQVGRRCNFMGPDAIPDIGIPGDTRRHIFLSVKEALHNAVKHSGSGTIDISFGMADEVLVITVKDHGRGMNGAAQPSPGNGLRNMEKRMGLLNGSLKIINENGVCVVFEIPLAQAAH